MDICICMAESLCYSSETTTTLFLVILQYRMFLVLKKKTNWEEMSRGWHFQDVYIIEVPGYLNYPEHLWVFAVLFPHEFKDEGSFFIMAHLCVNMGIFFNIMISVNTHSFFSLLVFSKYIKWCYYSAESLLAFKLESTNVWLLIKMI